MSSTEQVTNEQADAGEQTRARYPDERATSSATACASSRRSTAAASRRSCSCRPGRSCTRGCGRRRSPTSPATSAWSLRPARQRQVATGPRPARHTPRRSSPGRARRPGRDRRRAGGRRRPLPRRPARAPARRRAPRAGARHCLHRPVVPRQPLAWRRCATGSCPSAAAAGFKRRPTDARLGEVQRVHYWRTRLPRLRRVVRGACSREPHSTKGFEDASAWALETDPRHAAADRSPPRRAGHPRATSSALARRVQCPVLVISGTTTR